MAELRYRVIHGYRRAYRMLGSGPALLLVHGISDHSGTWAHLLPELAKRYTVIAPDLLGHGGSDKPRADYAAAAYACGMRDLLGVLDIDRVTVVGHSLGGFNMKLYAATYPADVAGLVLVDPSEERAGQRAGALERRRFGAAAEAQTRREERIGINALIAHLEGEGCEQFCKFHGLSPVVRWGDPSGRTASEESS